MMLTMHLTPPHSTTRRHKPPRLWLRRMFAMRRRLRQRQSMCRHPRVLPAHILVADCPRLCQHGVPADDGRLGLLLLSWSASLSELCPHRGETFAELVTRTRVCSAKYTSVVGRRQGLIASVVTLRSRSPSQRSLCRVHHDSIDFSQRIIPKSL